MTVEEMIKRKAELGYTNKMIAEKSGVPFGTVQKVFAGTSKHPRYGTMTALEKVLRKDTPSSYDSDITAAGIMRDASSTYGASSREDNSLRDTSVSYGRSANMDGVLHDYPSSYGRPSIKDNVLRDDHNAYGRPSIKDNVLRDDPAAYGRSANMDGVLHDDPAAYGRSAIKNNVLRDASAAYKCSAKKDGEYTLEDYYALPDEKRVELIDGIFYDMASPTSIHQLLITSIWKKLSDFITDSNGSCIPMVSPLDVQLDSDDRTMVQPDIIVVCDRSKIIKRCICGAPDLIIEVLSPGTRRKDMILKLGKYEHAGVSEYWLVDPDKKQVITFFFDCEEFTGPAIYSFDDKVPVGIFGGVCEIDFSEIYNYISFLY